MLGQTSPRDKHLWHRAAIPPALLSGGGGLHTLGGLFDKSCDSLWLRHVDGMTALDLNDRGARPLGHGTLGIGCDHLSSVAIRYQLGLAFHAGSLILPLRASTPHGTWESAMFAAFSASTSAAKEARNFPCRGTDNRPAAAMSAVRARRVADP